MQAPIAQLRQSQLYEPLLVFYYEITGL